MQRLNHSVFACLCLALGAGIASTLLGGDRPAPAEAIADAGLSTPTETTVEPAPEANWTPGELWALYQEDWAFSLPAEYHGKVAGEDYQFVGSDKPLRHSAYLADGLADGQRDGWTSMADEVALLSTGDFGFQEHPEPALAGVQPWRINGERAAKILNHGAARAVVLADGSILRQAKGEIEPRKAELLALSTEGFCLDWTGTLFQPGSQIEFEKGGAIQSAGLDPSCYPSIGE